MTKKNIFALDCQVMNYDWGVKGEKSLVAQLSKEENISADTHYAELWMGIHPNAPSKISETGELLSELIRKRPELLGEYTLRNWQNLPFLFKVLSIAKPLSIQAHPEKELARKLHAKYPEYYPDDNHKPEMAISISDFETLYGLISQEKLKKLFFDYPVLADFLEREKEIKLENIIPVVMNLPIPKAVKLLKDIKDRIDLKESPGAKEQLFKKLYPDYKEDIGLLFVLFMRKLSLKPDEFIFLKPNRLHSYLGGNLIECMANSDNVVRAGITKKYKDKDTMLQMLEYHQEQIDIKTGETTKNYQTRYSTAAKEFELISLDIPANELTDIELRGPQIILVLSGKGKLESKSVIEELEKGTVIFAGAKEKYQVKTKEKMKAIIATVPVPN